VGGAVRDRLLGVIAKDYDIECFGIEIEAFEAAMQHLNAQGVGKSFFVYKYHDIDIALPRTEKKTSHGHRGFEVTLAKEEKEASRRRDFTVNALMYDIHNETILDFWQGVDDLSNGVLRVVDENSFQEDSLRVLRAMQFAARFGFKIERNSCQLCQNISLDDLPKERICHEFEKMFQGKYLHYGLYYLFALKIAEKLWDEEIKARDFFSLSKVLQRRQTDFVEKLRPYYFLFILLPYLRSESEKILERLGVPNSYYKKIIGQALPQKIDCAFVARKTLKEGMVEYVGNYHLKVKELAMRLGVWEQPFQADVTPSMLVSQGFEGKALGEALQREIEKKIKGLHEDCS
jgi:tRNA nucleotidyltransferase (CCA-adding enzyme)